MKKWYELLNVDKNADFYQILHINNDRFEKYDRSFCLADFGGINRVKEQCNIIINHSKEENPDAYSEAIQKLAEAQAVLSAPESAKIYFLTLQFSKIPLDREANDVLEDFVSIIVKLKKNLKKNAVSHLVAQLSRDGTAINIIQKIQKENDPFEKQELQESLIQHCNSKESTPSPKEKASATDKDDDALFLKKVRRATFYKDKETFIKLCYGEAHDRNNSKTRQECLEENFKKIFQKYRGNGPPYNKIFYLETMLELSHSLENQFYSDKKLPIPGGRYNRNLFAVKLLQFSCTENDFPAAKNQLVLFLRELIKTPHIPDLDEIGSWGKRIDPKISQILTQFPFIQVGHPLDFPSECLIKQFPECYPLFIEATLLAYENSSFYSVFPTLKHFELFQENIKRFQYTPMTGTLVEYPKQNFSQQKLRISTTHRTNILKNHPLNTQTNLNQETTIDDAMAEIAVNLDSIQSQNQSNNSNFKKAIHLCHDVLTKQKKIYEQAQRNKVHTEEQVVKVHRLQSLTRALDNHLRLNNEVSLTSLNDALNGAKPDFPKSVWDRLIGALQVIVTALFAQDMTKQDPSAAPEPLSQFTVWYYEGIHRKESGSKEYAEIALLRDILPRARPAPTSARPLSN